MLKKTLFYLGLGPDEDYDSFDDYAPGSVAAAAPEAPPLARSTIRAVETPTVGVAKTVRPIGRISSPSGSVRAVPTPAQTAAAAATVPATEPEAIPAAVRIVGSRSVSPHALSPTTFNDAQSIGDRFKHGQAVIVNLQGADRDLRRRLVDFASGLCYALGGKMDRVADQVYLLTPPDVIVSTADTQRALD